MNGVHWGCWTDRPAAHPWLADIRDLACGYEERRADRRCAGCHRARAESAADQLAARHLLGDAARGFVPQG